MALHHALFRKRLTVKFPFEGIKPNERTVGRLVLSLEKCIGCGICARVCPTQAVEMVRVEGREKPAPKMDFGRCCYCTLCVYSCPKNALSTSHYYALATHDRGEFVYDPKELKPVHLPREYNLSVVYSEKDAYHKREK